VSFSVVTNFASLNSQAQLTKTQWGLETTLTRLSSGLRINSAADDAAGLAVANRFRMDNAGLAVGIRAANDGISRLQIEDGAINNISSLLDRAVTLAAQSASDTFLGSGATLETESQSVLAEMTKTATATGLETGSANRHARSVFVGNTQIATGTNVTYISFALTTTATELAERCLCPSYFADGAMIYNNRSNTYRQVALQTSSPTKLVVMLYEGAIRFLRESVSAIDSKDLDRKRQALDHAVAIVQHLQSTLDMDRGHDVAANLSALYSYITTRILEGSAERDTAPLKEAIKLLDIVLAGWEELAKTEQPPEALVG